MKRSELVPLKVVVEDLCVSATTLWRASKMKLPGWPAPVVIRRLIYWRKADLAALEEALLRFEGRGSFERQRDHAKKVKALTKARAVKRRRRDGASPDPSQKQLF